MIHLSLVNSMFRDLEQTKRKQPKACKMQGQEKNMEITSRECNKIRALRNHKGRWWLEIKLRNQLTNCMHVLQNITFKH